jgi:hypothetical protein
MTFVKSKKPKPKSTKQHRSRSNRKKFVQPMSLEEFLAMPRRYQELWGDIGQVTTEVRLGSTLNRAAQKFGIDPRTVKRLAKPALRKLRNGRWAARKTDRLLRVLPLPTSDGLAEVALADSRQATILGKYWNAVELYRNTGNASALHMFDGKYVIDADGNRVQLLTDIYELNRLGSAGVLSFESLYARVA